MKTLALAVASALLFAGCARVSTGAPTTQAAATAPTTQRSATQPATRAAKASPWEETIREFEAADRASPMPKDPIIFYGSSSIRGWRSLATDFPGKPVFNRGFGGSNYEEAARYVDRVIIPNKPSVLVLYSGDNDLASGRSPDRVVDDVKKLIARVHAELPETRIIILSIKPSESRFQLWPAMQETNAKLSTLAESDDNVDFLDVATPMLGENGRPRPELFLGDKLHMTPAGYALWTRLLAPMLR